MATPFKDGTYLYLVHVEGFETFKEIATTRNRAIYQSFKKYRAAGYGDSFIMFKKRIRYAKRFSSKILEDV